LTSLKTLCAGISVIDSTIDGRPFEKLNAIIPPVISNLLKPNFLSMSRLTAFFLFLIIRFYEGAKSSPVGKIFKNIFGKIFDEKINTILEEKEVVAKEITLSSNEKQNLQENDYLVTGSRYEAFREFMKFLIQKNGQNFFQVYPMMFDALTNELSKLNELDYLSINADHLQYLNIVEIYKTLKLLNILRRMQKELFSLKEVKIKEIVLLIIIELDSCGKSYKGFCLDESAFFYSE